MPANYDQARDIVKRVRFFDGQFLKDQDFIDDQKYHIDRQRHPNRVLRVSGICEGLTLAVDGSQLKVTPGTALDSQGRLIILAGEPFAVDLKNQTDILDIYISYGEEESDITQAGNDRTAPNSPDSTSSDQAKGAKGATRWWEKPRIEAVKDRSTLTGEFPIWLGRVTVSGSGANRTITITKIDDREYSGVYLPSSASPFEAPILRSGGNLAPKLAILTGDLKIQGTTSTSTAAGLNIANAANASLLYVRNDGNVGIGTTVPLAKLAINGGLHVGGDSDPGDNNLIVDGNSTVSGTLNFGSATRQMITLWGANDYGIGVQNGTQYFRTDKNFAWYKDGVHTNDELSAGTNGIVQMVIKDGNLGIGTTTAESKLTVNANILHDNSFGSYGDAPVTIFEPTSNGGNRPGATRDILNLVREGVADQAFGNKVSLAIGRYENVGFNSRTQLDIKLTDNSFNSHNTVLSLRSDGNVGIGTTTPKIHLAIGDDDTGLKQQGDGQLAIYTNNQERLRVDANGNVGLGTPTVSNPQGWARVFDVLGDNNARITARSSGGVINSVFSHDNWSGARGVIGTTSNHPLTFVTNYTHQMTIDGSGNVGIGTTGPGSKLDVSGVVRALTFQTTSPMQHRMYPNNPVVYQNIFDAKAAGAIKKLGNPAYDDTFYAITLWTERNLIKYGGNNENDGNGAEITIPTGYDTVWVRVLGERWAVMKAYFLDGAGEQVGHWTGGFRGLNCYCPDGSLSDGSIEPVTPFQAFHHQWVPIPAGRSGRLALISKTFPNVGGTTLDFWLSGVAFSKNPWGHAVQSAVGYHWAVNGGNGTLWATDWHKWNNDSLSAITAKSNFELKVPVVPSGQDKLLYLVEHNSNWNGCLHTRITVNNVQIERFLASYDNPFARHWNNKSFERYIAARIPASLINSTSRFLNVRVDMSKQAIGNIHFREIGTHDLEVPIQGW